MTLAELQIYLREADPSAVLVSPRILERVVRDDLRLSPAAWGLPHSKSYVCDRQMLFRHAEQADLELEPDQLLPGTVILLARPDAEEMSNLERKPVLLKYWRRLFHSRVHLALGAGRPGGPLSDAEVCARVGELGLTEFEEVRQVLTQDGFLPDNAGQRETYIEFAAVYLELRKFAPSLLGNYFPGVRDFTKVDQLLARDVDVDELYQKTRLRGAPDPTTDIQVRVDESQEAYWALVRQAQSAALENNRVKAAILRMKASRIAPGALTLPTRRESEADIANLTGRLADALKLNEAERDEWTRALIVLLDKADQGVWPVEARLLDDLQRVCEDSENEIFTLDVMDYLFSWGKRPIRRALPSQRLVRVVRHLASAHERLDEVRVADNDRQALNKLLTKALKTGTDNLNARFRPVLTTALEDVGLSPTNPVERVSFEKMVSELLDRVTTHGFITFGELRDTISRNQLKMPDTSDPESLWRGDPLIRLDNRLTSLLDGVYRPSDFYVRWLERGTAALFGTPAGRCLTRFLLMPVLLAWVVLFVLGFTLFHYVPARTHSWTHEPAMVLMGPLLGPLLQESDMKEHGAWDAPPDPHWGWHLGLLVSLSLFALGLLESPWFRGQLLRGLVVLWRCLRWALWDVPVGMVPTERIRQVLSGWLFQGVFWYIFVPALIALVGLWWMLFYRQQDLPNFYLVGVAIYLIAAVVLNSGSGRGVLDAARDVGTQLVVLIRAGLLPGLVRLISQVFQHISDMIEGALHAVDEWLRFRSGEGPLAVGARAVLGVIWFPIAFLIRLFYAVFLEPLINPLKLPISVVAGKILIPMYIIFGLQDAWTAALSPYVGPWLAWALVAAFMFFSPDAFGFLGWEMKENWNLYRANRSPTLQPQMVGSHGETVRGLLQPGFHSGTVPQLYARLRVAERRALVSRNWARVRQYRSELNHVAHDLERFLARELVALLKQSRAWQGVPVRAGDVFLATNRVRFEVLHDGHPNLPVQIEIQHHHGWMVAGLRDPGWLSRLNADQLEVFIICLAGFYKQADVDLVREQLQAKLPPPVASLEFTEDELRVRPLEHAQPVCYPLRDGLGFPNEEGPLRGKVFAWMDLEWDNWVGGWQADYDMGCHPGLPGVGLSLVNLANPPSRYVSQMPMIDSGPAHALPLPVSEGQQG